MKKLQDIFQDTYESDINVKNPEVSREAKVISDGNTKMKDMELGGKGDVSILKKKHISVSKKKGKTFDALEKKSLSEKILKKKNIVLKKKKQDSLLIPFFLYIKRYLRDLGIIGKIITACIVVLCLFVGAVADKIFIESRVNAGYQKLLTIKDGNLELSEIRQKVNDARFDLLIADAFFTPFALLPGDKIDSVSKVIEAGRYMSRSLDDILALYTKIDEFIAEKSLQNIYFTQLFINIAPELENIQKNLERALENYKTISWLPNQGLHNRKQSAIEGIEKILVYMRVLNSNFSEFLSVLGHEEKKRYLIVFQNADEIRPTGGFMGSMGLLEIFKGKIDLFQKKDVYAIEWDLKKSDYERLDAPKGINTLTDTFGLRDANYYINLKDSSETIKFFTDSAGIDIDGIIYINQNILLKLLDVTGPVYFEPLEREVTSENFSEIMSLVVEAKTFKKGTLGTPKQVLFDFMEVFSQHLISDGKYFDYLQTLIHEVESRDILMWSFDESENEFLTQLGINGAIEYDSSLDFTYPVYTSLSGNKSDRYMKRKYIQKIIQAENCDININFTIESSHDMGKLKRERIQNLIGEYNLVSPNLFEIQGAATNKQFVRILLPKDAKISAKKDMKIVDYGKRKGIEFFLNTQLQETSYYDIDYTLENPSCDNYDYTLYKQSGIPEYDIEMQIENDTFKYQNRKEDFYFKQR